MVEGSSVQSEFGARRVPFSEGRALRRALLTCLSAAAPLGLAGSCSERAPSVVLVSLDSVRADALTFRDPAASPRLTELAREGTVFTQAISGSSWTLPAHAQLFTGSPPVLHGVQYDDVAIDPSTPTLPEILHAAGWFTAGFWTGWFVAGEYGFARGFDLYANAMTDGDLLEREYRRAVAAGDFDQARRILGGRDVLGHQDVTSGRVVERVREIVRRVDDDEPLFLFVHLFDPHYDYVPPAPWDTRFDPDYAGEMDGRDYYRDLRVFDPDATPRRRIGARDLEHVIALYRGEIGWTDAAVGEMLDELRSAGRFDDALIVVTSDHGDEFFEHGGRGHRHSLFDELLRVPLLVRLPAASAVPSRPATVEEQVSLSDVAPTILDALGLPVPRSMDGRSLVPALRGEGLSAIPVVSTLVLMPAEGPPVLFDALRTPETKLIRRLAVDREGRLRVKEVLCFDLGTDPGEQHPENDPQHPSVTSAMRTLDAELARLRTRFDALEHSPDEFRSTRIREVFEDELSDLGYTDDTGSASPGFARPWGLGPHPPPDVGPGPRSDGDPGRE